MTQPEKPSNDLLKDTKKRFTGAGTAEQPFEPKMGLTQFQALELANQLWEIDPSLIFQLPSGYRLSFSQADQRVTVSVLRPKLMTDSRLTHIKNWLVGKNMRVEVQLVATPAQPQKIKYRNWDDNIV